jgi:diguanylate cyclase (GGDEF)-like protein
MPARAKPTVIIDPHQRFIRRTGLFLLLISALGAAFVAWLHSRQAAPQTLDLVMSNGLALSLAVLFVWLLRRPDSFTRVIWTGIALALVAIAVPAWVYPFRAMQTPGMTLVDSLPPITSALMPLILAMIVFVRPRQALIAASFAWVIVAGPILFYLLTHPVELHSARGMDMAITLGPVMLIVLIYIPFHRGLEQWVSTLQSERAKLQALAERDGLTGLYNRRASEHLLMNLVAAPNTDDALILFDIDHFKAVNDTHGHPVGDEVLRQVARRCEALLRRDDVFARWGGEEFLLLVRGARGEAIAQIADSMRLAISATPIEPAGIVTASFGVALFRPLDTLATWVQRADGALYAAKAGGRNRVVAQ